MSVQFNQAAQEGIYLRFPDNITPQRELNYESAVNMLLRAMSMAQTIPFSWAYIDKPMDGSIYLLFHPVNTPFVIDGIRYQDPEVKYTIPAGTTRELEVWETKFGFIPNFQDTSASRVRRRYRLIKGGNPQLMLVHYTRGPATQIPPALMNQPVRLTPLRPLNEPQTFVAGEKMGQKVYPPGVGPMHGPSPSMVPPIGMNMNFSQQQAMLAQQNSNMEALDQRRRERERQQQQERAAQRPPPPRMVEDEDSGDEVDSISTRTLALARYKRNHDWMNDVFNQAAFGKRSAAPKRPYSIFSKPEIEEKTAKLQAELDVLQMRSAQRRADKIREAQSGQGDVSMTSIGESILV